MRSTYAVSMLTMVVVHQAPPLRVRLGLVMLVQLRATAPRESRSAERMPLQCCAAPVPQDPGTV